MSAERTIQSSVDGLRGSSDLSISIIVAADVVSRVEVSVRRLSAIVIKLAIHIISGICARTCHNGST